MEEDLVRRCVSALLTTAAALCLLAVGTVLTGRVGVVQTYGVSMHPTYQQGDLVLVSQRPSYRVGDIAAYHRPHSAMVVLHRIVGDGPRGLVFKGDNNQSTDVDHPMASSLIGTAFLHIPHGGTWLHRLVGPVPLAVFACFLLAGSGRVLHTHRRRRRRTMSRHASTVRGAKAVPELSPGLKGVAVACACAAVLGGALSAFAWARPTTQSQTVPDISKRSMTFAYFAHVPRSAAYDGTTASSPQPVFRRLAETVTVRFVYDGDPGTFRVSADLASAGGWRSTVPLPSTVEVGATQHRAVVRLDLGALSARATAAALATGLPDGPTAITLRPTVTAADGSVFAPALALVLTPLQLSLAGPPASLRVEETRSGRRLATVPRMLVSHGRQVAASTARWLAGLLLLVGLAGLAVVRRLAAGQAVDEGSRIRRAHAPLLVRVHPIAAPTGVAVIDVAEFPTLVKLAERYGLLILHWSRSDVETFIVQDETTSYRYRTAAGAVRADRPGPRHAPDQLPAASPPWESGLHAGPARVQ